MSGDAPITTVLDEALASCMSPMLSLGAELDAGSLGRVGYTGYLMCLHQIIRCSVPLMQDAHEACRTRDTATHAAFAAYLEQHIPEERGHDDWLLEDLERLGVPADVVLDAVPHGAVAHLAGSQYYWIRHDDPIALAGYIAVLEGFPPGIEQLRAAAERNSIPWEAMSTLRKHSSLDVHHRAELRSQLDSLPLDQRQRRVVTRNAVRTAVDAAACLRHGVAAAAMHLEPVAL